MGKLKDLKRRGIETFLQAVGASETTVDTVYTEEYDKFNIMVDDLNEIGAGLSEYLISLKQNYGLGSDLAAVMDSYYNGELNRPWVSANPNLSHLSMHNEVAKMKQAWEENDDIVRKSVAHVWINRGLTPMRAFVNQVTPDIEEACRTRENYRKDADSYRRRYLAAEKKSMSAPTPEKQAEANQEQAKLKVKLENANTLYETQNTLVKAELEKAKIARDEAIEMMVITVAACQMELFEQCYKRLVTACADFPADKMKQVRASIQNEMRAGGPNLGGGPKGLSHQVGKAANIVSGKKGMNDYKREKEEKAVRDQAALDRARQVAMEDERRRAAGLSGPPSPPTRGGVSKGPPLPPKRFSNPTVQPPSVTSFAPKAKAPPPVPVRGGGGSSSPKAKVPPPVPVRGGGGGGGGVASRAAAFNRPPAIPSQRPPALPKKSAPPPPPKRASAAPTCRALFDNVPDDSDELAFKVGDIITIIKKDDSGWWEGTIRGKKGIFPSNFVKEI